jgi:hypothetical protein
MLFQASVYHFYFQFDTIRLRLEFKRLENLNDLSSISQKLNSFDYNFRKTTFYIVFLTNLELSNA